MPSTAISTKPTHAIQFDYPQEFDLAREEIENVVEVDEGNYELRFDNNIDFENACGYANSRGFDSYFGFKL